MNVPVLPWETLQRFATQTIEALGTPAEAANLVATHLVEANLAGHDSHGIYRLVQYCEHVQQGHLDPKAEPRVERETGTTATIDGCHGWGPVAAQLAIQSAVTKAKQHGVAAVTMRRTYHVGRVGPYPAWAAKQGQVAMAFCNVQGAHRVALVLTGRESA